MPYKLSKKEQRAEILKCGRDPVYFIKTYCKISHPHKGLIPFKTFDYQDDLLRDFNNYRFNIILKARQLGISTIVGAYVAWMMMFHREKNILVVATKFSTAGNLVKKVKQIIKHLPDWIRITKITTDNRTAFELSNGSQIKASSTSADAGRSEALSLLVVDEAAHVEGIKEMWAGIYPTLSTGGNCIALSTPNGVGNWFYEKYVEAVEGENEFHPIRLNWDVHPERDKTWFEKETKNMSQREIAQELECNFNMSGETVINPEDVDFLRQMIKEPKYRVGFDRNYWIWENYSPSNTYLMTVDVARGDGADNSAFHIIKLETMEVVAEYRGKPNLDMFANLVNTVGREYGNCLLVVENATVGFNVLEKLQEMQYPNLYYSIKSTHEYIDQIEAEYRNGTVPGFTNSMKTRPLIIAKLEEFIRNRILKSYSERLVHELESFVWQNGRPQAMKGRNDDLVMALAIGCWVRDTAITSSQRDVAYSKAMLNSIVVANTKLNTTMPGQMGYKKRQDPGNMHNQTARDHFSQYDWLYKG